MPNRQVPEGYVGVRDFEEFKRVLEEALARGEKKWNAKIVEKLYSLVLIGADVVCHILENRKG